MPAVASAGYHDLATSHYRFDEASAADEEECVEPVLASSHKIRMAGIEKDQICPQPRRYSSHRLGERLGAPGERSKVDLTPCRFTSAARKHITRLVHQSLTVFKLSQFGRGIDLNVGISADSKDAARTEIARGVEDAISEIGFRDGTKAGRCAGGGKSTSFILPHVRAMNEAPVAVDVEIVQQPLHRRSTEMLDAFIHFSSLFGSMNVNWPLRLQRYNVAQLRRGYCTQRMGGDPDLAMRKLVHDGTTALQ